jgi:uncharacterized protein (DUF2147 family)
MKHVLIFAMLISVKGYAQNADAIVGKWLKANKEDLIIEVYKDKDNEEYNGKINWSKDKEKPAGFLMIENLRYNQKEKRWEDGKIHDPKSGRSYDATVVMKPDGTIEVSGAVLFFKSKRIFKRVK